MEYRTGETVDGVEVLLLGVYTEQTVGTEPYVRPLCAWSADTGIQEMMCERAPHNPLSLQTCTTC